MRTTKERTMTGRTRRTMTGEDEDVNEEIGGG